MATLRQQLIAFLAGQGDEQTNAYIRRQLEQPESAVAKMYAAMKRVLKDPFSPEVMQRWVVSSLLQDAAAERGPKGLPAVRDRVLDYCQAAPSILSRFRTLREYERLETGAIAAATGDPTPGAVFPDVHDDVPVVAVWPAAVPQEGRQAGLVRAWLAYYDCRLFWIATVAADRAADWQSADVSLDGPAGAVACRHVRAVAEAGPASVWGSFWLAEPADAAVRHLAFAPLPVPEAVALAEQPAALRVRRRGVQLEWPVWPLEQALRHQADVFDLLALLLGGLQRRSQQEAARAALVEALAAHRYEPGSGASRTFAFYAFWVVQVRRGDGPFLDRDDARRLWQSFTDPGRWPEPLARRLLDLLRERHGSLE
jgi:hypothetical protein